MIDTAKLSNADIGKTVYVPVEVMSGRTGERRRAWIEGRIVSVYPEARIMTTFQRAVWQVDPAQCEWNPPPEALLL